MGPTCETGFSYTGGRHRESGGGGRGVVIHSSGSFGSKCSKHIFRVLISAPEGVASDGRGRSLYDPIARQGFHRGPGAWRGRRRRKGIVFHFERILSLDVQNLCFGSQAVKGSCGLLLAVPECHHHHRARGDEGREISSAAVCQIRMKAFTGRNGY